MWDYFETLPIVFPSELQTGADSGNLLYLSGGSFLKSDLEEGGLIYKVFEGSGHYGILPLEFVNVR